VVLAVVVLPVFWTGAQIRHADADGGDPEQDETFQHRVLPPLRLPCGAAESAERQRHGTPESKGPNPRRRSWIAEGERRNGQGTREDGCAKARRAQRFSTTRLISSRSALSSNPDNAKQVQDRAASAGIKSYTEISKALRASTTRVRAGPSRAGAAEKARDKLKSLGLEVGRVAQR